MNSETRLAQARRRAGLSLHACAAALDITTARIVALEAGVLVPTWATCQRLAEVLGGEAEDYRQADAPQAWEGHRRRRR